MSTPIFELTPTGAWVLDAACGGRWDLMEGIGEYNERHAEMLCQGCPVRQDCWLWVMSLAQRYDPDGIVAGLTNDERARGRRQTTRHSRARALRRIARGKADA